MIDAVRIGARFDNYESFILALGRLKEASVPEYTSFGPTDLKEIENLMPNQSSPVRPIATTGLLAGLALFWAMAITTSLIYDLVVGGKPPISNVPFVVTAYEGAILLSGVAALTGVIIFASLDFHKPIRRFESHFTSDNYGIEVRCRISESARVRRLLEEAGASEIEEAPS